ncbi:MAG: 3-keto-5-aminohexanoate cleavage protein [Rhodopila sp.]
MSAAAPLVPGVAISPASSGDFGRPVHHQFEVAQWALELGGHCRTGLEDNIRMDRDTLAPSNAALVARVAGMAAAAGRPVASAQEARAVLGLSVITQPAVVTAKSKRCPG